VSSRGVVKIADFGLARIYTCHIALTPCVWTSHSQSNVEWSGALAC